MPFLLSPKAVFRAAEVNVAAGKIKKVGYTSGIASTARLKYTILMENTLVSSTQNWRTNQKSKARQNHTKIELEMNNIFMD